MLQQTCFSCIRGPGLLLDYKKKKNKREGGLGHQRKAPTVTARPLANVLAGKISDQRNLETQLTEDPTVSKSDL